MKDFSNLALLSDEQLSNVVGGGDKADKAEKDVERLLDVKKSWKNSSTDKKVLFLGASAFGIATFSTFIYSLVKNIKKAF